MTKDYTEEKINKDPKIPSDQSIEFILNYSKSLHFLNLKKTEDQVELNLN